MLCRVLLARQPRILLNLERDLNFSHDRNARRAIAPFAESIDRCFVEQTLGNRLHNLNFVDTTLCGNENVGPHNTLSWRSSRLRRVLGHAPCDQGRAGPYVVGAGTAPHVSLRFDLELPD